MPLPCRAAAVVLLAAFVLPAHGQLTEKEADDWMATFGRPALRGLLAIDNPALAPAADLMDPTSVPYDPAGGILAGSQAQAPSPLQRLAANTVQDAFSSNASAASQQAALQSLLPSACPIQLVDFNLLTPDMLAGCTGMSEADVKEAPFMQDSQLCRMLPTYQGLAFGTTTQDTLPWLVVDMVITNGYGGAYCALRGGRVTPQGGVNGSCTLLQTTWIKDPSINITNIADGPKVIRAATNGTFNLHQLTAIVQAPGVLIHGVRADENIISRPLKMIQSDGTTITKFNTTLWSNLVALEFTPVRSSAPRSLTSFQMFKMQVSFC